jgi:hypothetical protein
MQPPATESEYTPYVEHPRYGRTPRFTDLQPGAIPSGYRRTIYHDVGLIEGTAVESDLDCQSFSPVPVLYYFDLNRTCADCARPFLFFAEEQKYWYETLGFDLGADCVRCVECRSKLHGIEKQRRRYEALFHVQSRSIEENLGMAQCCLSLIQAGLFNRRQTERVRMLLNNIPENQGPDVVIRCEAIRRALIALGP